MLACASAPVPAPAAPSVEVEIVSTSVRSGVGIDDSRELEYSAAMLRFVDNDHSRAAKLVEGLMTTAFFFSNADCRTSDPTQFRKQLALTEEHILHAVVFSLAYEFEQSVSGNFDGRSKQAMAILNALEQRLETSQILFPKLELLTPEEAALAMQGPARLQSHLFPSYVEMLYTLSTANLELADKKARIVEKIPALRESMTTLYFRADRASLDELCPAIDVLTKATEDALLWAVDEVPTTDGAELNPQHELSVAVALTNLSREHTLIVEPHARLWFSADDGKRADVRVGDVALDSQPTLDNNLPPGVTHVRTFTGVTSAKVGRLCDLQLELADDRGARELSVEIAACSAQ
jgi:hypothetical protein